MNGPPIVMQYTTCPTLEVIKDNHVLALIEKDTKIKIYKEIVTWTNKYVEEE